MLDNGSRLYAKIERIYVDLDFLEWPPLTICLSGMLRYFPGGNKMVLRYRELAHNDSTVNSSVNHDYIFRTSDEQLVEFGQSIRACPSIPEPRQEVAVSDEFMDQVERGTRLLKRETGNQLEASAGDCGLLFDRVAFLLQ